MYDFQEIVNKYIGNDSRIHTWKTRMMGLPGDEKKYDRVLLNGDVEYRYQTRTVLTKRVSSYGLPAWVSSELGPMGGTTFTTSAAALEPGHY